MIERELSTFDSVFKVHDYGADYVKNRRSRKGWVSDSVNVSHVLEFKGRGTIVLTGGKKRDVSLTSKEVFELRLKGLERTAKLALFLAAVHRGEDAAYLSISRFAGLLDSKLAGIESKEAFSDVVRVDLAVRALPRMLQAREGQHQRFFVPQIAFNFVDSINVLRQTLVEATVSYKKLHLKKRLKYLKTFSSFGIIGGKRVLLRKAALHALNDSVGAITLKGKREWLKGLAYGVRLPPFRLGVARGSELSLGVLSQVKLISHVFAEGEPSNRAVAFLSLFLQVLKEVQFKSRGKASLLLWFKRCISKLLEEVTMHSPRKVIRSVSRALFLRLLRLLIMVVRFMPAIDKVRFAAYIRRIIKRVYFVCYKESLRKGLALREEAGVKRYCLKKGNLVVRFFESLIMMEQSFRFSKAKTVRVVSLAKVKAKGKIKPFNQLTKSNFFKSLLKSQKRLGLLKSFRGLLPAEAGQVVVGLRKKGVRRRLRLMRLRIVKVLRRVKLARRQVLCTLALQGANSHAASVLRERVLPARLLSLRAVLLEELAVRFFIRGLLVLQKKRRSLALFLLVKKYLLVAGGAVFRVGFGFNVGRFGFPLGQERSLGFVGAAVASKFLLVYSAMMAVRREVGFSDRVFGLFSGVGVARSYFVHQLNYSSLVESALRRKYSINGMRYSAGARDFLWGVDISWVHPTIRRRPLRDRVKYVPVQQMIDGRLRNILRIVRGRSTLWYKALRVRLGRKLDRRVVGNVGSTMGRLMQLFVAARYRLSLLSLRRRSRKEVAFVRAAVGPFACYGFSRRLSLRANLVSDLVSPVVAARVLPGLNDVAWPRLVGMRVVREMMQKAKKYKLKFRKRMKSQRQPKYIMPDWYLSVRKELLRIRRIRSKLRMKRKFVLGGLKLKRLRRIRLKNRKYRYISVMSKFFKPYKPFKKFKKFKKKDFRRNVFGKGYHKAGHYAKPFSKNEVKFKGSKGQKFPRDNRVGAQWNKNSAAARQAELDFLAEKQRRNEQFLERRASGFGKEQGLHGQGQDKLKTNLDVRVVAKPFQKNQVVLKGQGGYDVSNKTRFVDKKVDVKFSSVEQRKVFYVNPEHKLVPGAKHEFVHGKALEENKPLVGVKLQKVYAPRSSYKGNYYKGNKQHGFDKVKFEKVGRVEHFNKAKNFVKPASKVDESKKV